jgi:hypothetical protein
MRLSRVRWPAVLLLAVVVLFSSAMPASATISGTLLTGSAGTITYSLTSITINTDPSSTPPGPPWNGEVANGTSLTFAGCGGVLGSPGCLSVTEAIEFAKNTPINFGTPLSTINPFIQFAAHPVLQFTATAILPGSANANCAAAVNTGDSCSPFAGFPLLLTRTAVGTEVSFAVLGTATDGTGTSTWSGQLESPIIGETPAQVQSALAAGTVTSSQSGAFLVSAGATVPEPTTISLLGFGLLMLGRGLRKRTAR